MANNMIDAVTNVFKYIKESINEDVLENITNDIPRTIAEDKYSSFAESIFKKCKFTAKKYNNALFMIIWYNEEKYILTLQKYESSLIQIGYIQNSSSSIDQAFGILAISNKILSKKSTIADMEILDNCLGIEKEKSEDKYIRIDWNVIKNFFEEYVIFKCVDASYEILFEEDIARLYALLILMNNESTIDFKERTANIRQLKSFNCVIDNLIFALESKVHKFQYLQLYQCIEYLFTIFIALEIVEKHNISKSKALSISLDSYLRISELSIIQKIIKKYVNSNTICILHNNFFDNDTNTKDKYISDLAERIYKIRCTIAHLKYQQEEYLSDISWGNKIELLIEVITSIYKNIDKDLVDIALENHIWTPINN